VTSLIAISLVFGASALLLMALLVTLARRQMAKRAEQVRTEKVSKRIGDKAALPPVEPERPARRTRVISAAPLAEAEAKLSPRLGTLSAARGEPSATKLPDAIVAAGRQAIVLRRNFPPHLAPSSRSFYGGVPQVPGPFAWPHDPESGKSLHFILQLDLAAVPDSARLGLLPPSGALLFFLDLQWGNGQTGAVMWVDGGDFSSWQEVDPPADLALAYGDEGAYAWPWALAAEHGVPLLPRWPFEPVAVVLPEAVPAFDGDDAGQAVSSWADTEATAQALLTAQTGGTDEGTLPERYGPQDFTGPDGDRFIAPWPGFPQDWLAVQTCAAALVREADRALRFPRRSLYPDLDDEARAAHLTAVKEEAQAWFDHALNNPALGAIEAPVRTAFWEWFAGHKPLTQLIAAGAAEAAIETTLHASPQEAAKIPPEVVARVAYRHVLAQRTAQGGIHAPTPNRLLAPFSDVQGDQQERAATHVLLLELSSDEAIGHRFGEGVYQFWITPDDLAERLFDKAVLTTTAY
jgi:hypothetical protein